MISRHSVTDTLLSIIIPTYNRANRLVGTIQSILNQNYPLFEIIVVDDGSTDNTEQVVSGLTDHRIKYFNKKNEERAVARNFGIDQATGEYITFLDSDDLLYPHFLDEAIKVIQENGNSEWLHLAYEIRDEKSKIIRQENMRQGNINKNLLTGNHLSCIGVFVRNDIIRKHRFVEDQEIIGSEDYLLWLNLAKFYPLKYSNRISACMIQHQDRSVMGFSPEKLENRILKSISFIERMGYQGDELATIKAHRFLYLSLHLAMGGYLKKSLSALLKAINYRPGVLASKKFLAILKQIASTGFRVSA
jgi:glycosyltransferase involved in cell wall biosynthesis